MASRENPGLRGTYINKPFCLIFLVKLRQRDAQIGCLDSGEHYSDLLA